MFDSLLYIVWREKEGRGEWTKDEDFMQRGGRFSDFPLTLTVDEKCGYHMRKEGTGSAGNKVHGGAGREWALGQRQTQTQWAKKRKRWK